MTGRFLPGVPGKEIERIFNAAPGNEIANGKFDSLESSAALAANAFGFFLNRERDLPLLPKCGRVDWAGLSLSLEQEVRFPWRGGRHPVLDVLITTRSAFIGIESKRFEPFRGKTSSTFSDAYWRPVWGNRMKGYERIRDQLREDGQLYACLDAAQLVKHAFALRTAVNRSEYASLTPILFYVYAEPEFWPKSGKPVKKKDKIMHRAEIDRFTNEVARDEVQFIACSYTDVLRGWKESKDSGIREHVEAVIERFAVRPSHV